MEHLSIRDTPSPASGGKNDGSQPGATPVPQLPPQMFTTAAQLLDLTDTNLVLQDTIERVFVQKLYADIPRGLYIVRGENVLLLGEIDLDKDDYIPEPFEQAPADKVFALQKAEQEERKRASKTKTHKLRAFGFEGESAGEVLF
ncbi:MAG: SM-like, degradation of cytoplasmic mRNAs and positively regulates transcription initiation [Piccolia ochrophora]|nr:MAG: SM-like, degradation of cytoplasmic mRNAs and positively regulates transcription initiation [Piccolia ochrophora]